MVYSGVWRVRNAERCWNRSVLLTSKINCFRLSAVLQQNFAKFLISPVNIMLKIIELILITKLKSGVESISSCSSRFVFEYKILLSRRFQLSFIFIFLSPYRLTTLALCSKVPLCCPFLRHVVSIFFYIFLCYRSHETRQHAWKGPYLELHLTSGQRSDRLVRRISQWLKQRNIQWGKSIS